MQPPRASNRGDSGDLAVSPSAAPVRTGQIPDEPPNELFVSHSAPARSS